MATDLVPLEVDGVHRLPDLLLRGLALPEGAVHLLECHAGLADGLGPVERLRLGERGLVHLSRFGKRRPPTAGKHRRKSRERQNRCSLVRSRVRGPDRRGTYVSNSDQPSQTR